MDQRLNCRCRLKPLADEPIRPFLGIAHDRPLPMETVIVLAGLFALMLIVAGLLLVGLATGVLL